MEDGFTASNVLKTQISKKLPRKLQPQRFARLPRQLDRNQDGKNVMEDGSMAKNVLFKNRQQQSQQLRQRLQ